MATLIVSNSESRHVNTNDIEAENTTGRMIASFPSGSQGKIMLLLRTSMGKGLYMFYSLYRNGYQGVPVTTIQEAIERELYAGRVVREYESMQEFLDSLSTQGLSLG